MSATKTTRSSTKIKKEPNASAVRKETVAAVRKVVFIPEALLEIDANSKDQQQLHLERFYQPGKGRSTLFLSQRNNGKISELLEFAEPRRSWLINSDVCSNGRIYLTAPVDTTFFALHQLRKHCAQKALALDSIHDDADPMARRMLLEYVQAEHLSAIADVKTAGDMVFYKYNPERTLAWLALKTKRVVQALRSANVYCGLNAISQNYSKGERNVSDDENTGNDADYTRMACDIVGSYLDADLHEELIQYLGIPSEIQAIVDEKELAVKRKSQDNLKLKTNKKIKLETENADTDAAEKLQNNSLLDSSLDGERKAPSDKPTSLKERILTAKEKALAKGAKGTKSIASFFKKA